MNPFMKLDTCSRCNKEGIETVWHICRDCRDKAQKEYQDSIKGA